MNSPTALVAHPFPIVVDALAAFADSAGYSVTRTSDAAAAAAALEAVPDLALVGAAFDALAALPARNGTTRTLVFVDDVAVSGDTAISLTAPAAAVAAAIRAAAQAHFTASKTPALTSRERDVARLVAAGHRNRSIAAELGISEGTVKMHLHNVYTKLGLESRTQLAMSVKAGA